MHTVEYIAPLKEHFAEPPPHVFTRSLTRHWQVTFDAHAAGIALQRESVTPPSLSVLSSQTCWLVQMGPVGPHRVESVTELDDVEQPQSAAMTQSPQHLTT